MAEQWIDWHPKVGDIKPERYRYRRKYEVEWNNGEWQGVPVTQPEIDNADWQIPAPVVTPPEDRPPWIDPQCKFRWGDRVKDRKGNIWFVNHPNDDLKFPVVCTKTRNYLHPYVKWNEQFIHDSAVEVFNEDELELFPEELPQHFDDRLLDADQPQEQPKTARVPREIWVNRYPDDATPYGSIHATRDRADLLSRNDRVECIHFREVL